MFFTQHKNKEATLVVDIGSSSVGAALVLASTETSPKILFSTRLPVVLQNESERNRSLAAVLQTLESVMKLVAAEHIVVRKSHVFFSSPWYVSETNILKVDHDSPTLITHHTIEQLIKQARQKYEEKPAPKGEIVEHRVIRTRLNGYDTPDPYNKRAKTLEVTFFTSAVEKDILESVHRTIGKYFHFKNNENSSFSLVAFSAISGMLPDERNFLIVDVRGEVTDMSLVTEGALIKSQSFPQGKNALIQAVVSGSGQSPTSALSLINTAFHGHGGPAAQNDVAKFAETFKQSWLEAYMKAIQEISAQTVFLMADQDVEIFFENILNEIKDGSNLRSLKHLNLKDYLETSSVQIDPFLALESIFVTMM